MATATPSSSTPVWGYPVFVGWALGMTITSLMTAAQLSIPHELIALASGIMISFRSLGGTIGISICELAKRPSSSSSSPPPLSSSYPSGKLRSGFLVTTHTHKYLPIRKPSPVLICIFFSFFLDTAVFASALDKLGTNIAEAVLGAGLPESSVTDFISALTAENDTALALVPGVTTQIIDVGVGALSDTYSSAFRNVWVSAVGFVALAAIGTFWRSRLQQLIFFFFAVLVIRPIYLLTVPNELQRPAFFSIHAESSTTTLTHRWRRKRNSTPRRRLSR